MIALCGDTAFYVFGASDEAALPLNAGYALQWWIVGWVATLGARWYDLGGEAGTPGLRQFKKGLVGNRGVVLDTCRELDRSLDGRARVAADAIYLLRDVQRAARALWRSSPAAHFRRASRRRAARRDPLTTPSAKTSTAHRGR